MFPCFIYINIIVPLGEKSSKDIKCQTVRGIMVWCYITIRYFSPCAGIEAS